MHRSGRQVSRDGPSPSRILPQEALTLGFRNLALVCFPQGVKVKDSASKKKAIALLEARKAAVAAAMEED